MFGEQFTGAPELAVFGEEAPSIPKAVLVDDVAEPAEGASALDSEFELFPSSSSRVGVR